MHPQLPNSDQLMQHRRFLRALAWQLVGDEHLAEDLVQESYAAAIDNPPRTAEALKSWLAKVVVRRAKNKHRSEARRSRREAEAASHEALPSTQEVSESLHTQRRVLEALDALPEPQRMTIFLRWYEGLPPREIARRMNVPVETVRSRVQRGLARLRTELDAEFGARENWAVGLLPLLRTERSLLTAPWIVACSALALSIAGVIAWTQLPRAILPHASSPVETMRALATSEGERAPRNDSSAVDTRVAHTSISSVTDSTHAVLADRIDVAELDELLGEPTGDGPHFELDLTLPPGVRVDDLVAELHSLNELSRAGQHMSLTARVQLGRDGKPPFVEFPPMPALSLIGRGDRSANELRVMSADGDHAATVRVHALAGAYPVVVPLTLDPSARIVVQLADPEGAQVQSLPTLRVQGRVRSRAGDDDFALPLRLQGVDDAREIFFAWPTRADNDEGTWTYDFGELPQAEYVLLPPAESSFAWNPPYRKIVGTESAADMERLDGGETRRVRVRAKDLATGATLTSFQATLLVDRFGSGRRGAAQLEQNLEPRASSDGEVLWSPIERSLPIHWLVECDGYMAQQGTEAEFVSSGGEWMLEVQLVPAWRATFWAGSRDALGRRRPIEGVRLLTKGGRELGRSLADGFIHLELCYDPGRLRIEAEGWRERKWTGFWRGKPTQALDLYEIWMEREL